VTKRKYKNKYKKELTWDETLVYFVVKVVGLTALFFIVAIGADVYRLSH
jgi:hypothetical protein